MRSVDVCLATFSALVLLSACKKLDETSDPLTAFNGEPDALVNSVLERSEIEIHPEDYSELPSSPGVVASHGAVLLELGESVTVAEANALFAEYELLLSGVLPPLSGGNRGLLYVRLPVDTHLELAPVLADLTGRAEVASITRDLVSDAKSLPAKDSARPEWSWEVEFDGGNWGFEMMQVPQMWNILPAVEKRAAKGGSTPNIDIGIIDGGFDDAHHEFDGVFVEAHTSDTLRGLNVDQYGLDSWDRGVEHGTNVAGIIGADHDGNGIDGIHPYAKLHGMGIRGAYLAATTEVDYEIGFTAELFWRLDGLFRQDVPLINYSMGFAFPDAYDPSADPVVAEMIDDEAETLMYRLDDVAAADHAAPVIVAAAGNSSGNVPIEYASPPCRLATEFTRADVYCIEALEHLGGQVVGLELKSNAGSATSMPGTHSAPGAGIMTTSHSFDSGYASFSHTSSATPHVTGVLGLLLSAAPELTPVQLRQAVNRAESEHGTAAAAPAIAGYDALLTIDEVRGNDIILTMLLDIDDGTPDGNLREDVDGNSVTTEDRDNDGGMGDGDIDMSDFRRFRDWLLAAQAGGAEPLLDGSASHAKRDVNGDGRVGTRAEENVYPRGDFNGDGILSDDAADSRKLPGFGDLPVSDLDVLTALFDDPDYLPEDLPGLVASGDIQVYGDACFDVLGVESVTVTVFDDAGVPVGTERFILPTEAQVFTVPADADYRVRIYALDSSDEIIAGHDEKVPVGLGEDVLFDDCNYMGTTTVLSVDGENHPGAPEPPLNGIFHTLEAASSAETTRSGEAWVSPDGFCLEVDATSPGTTRGVGASFAAATDVGFTAGMPIEFTVDAVLDKTGTGSSSVSVTVWFRTVKDHDTASSQIAVFTAYIDSVMTGSPDYWWSLRDGGGPDVSGTFTSGDTFSLDLTGYDAVMVEGYASAKGGDAWMLMDMGGCP